MPLKILVLPGDGIGPEITEATLTVLDRANARFKLGLEWQIEEIGFAALKKHGSTLPDGVMEAARTADLGGEFGTRAFAKHVAALIG